MQFDEQPKATISYIHQKDDNIPDYGLALPPESGFGTRGDQLLPVSRGKHYGVRTNGHPDTEQIDAHILPASVDAYFTKDRHLAAALRFRDVDRFRRARATRFSTATNPYEAPVGRTLFDTTTRRLTSAVPLHNIRLRRPSYFKSLANTLARTIALHANAGIALDEYLENLGGLHYVQYTSWQYIATMNNIGTVTQATSGSRLRRSHST